MKFGMIVCDPRNCDFYLSRYRMNDSLNEWIPIFAINGEIPTQEQIATYDGFLTSGSGFSANDETEWMLRLEEFFRQIRDMNQTNKKKIRVFAVSFGHQLMAKAFGGTISRNADEKFAFGSERINVSPELSEQKFYKKVFGETDYYTIMESHGERVAQLPEEALSVGSSATCEHEVLLYGDNIISTQGHPAFTKEIMKDMLLPFMRKLFNWSDDDVASKIATMDKVRDEQMNRMVDFVREFLMYRPDDVDVV